ncbi:MAG: NAD-dependent epimerase/dehydratase family protein [Pseudomonadota bacterium]
MRSIPQHLEFWRESAEWDDFPSVVVLGASGRIGRALRVFWPKALPVTWVARSEGPVRCDPLKNPEEFAQICKGADVILSVAGDAPGGALKSPADLADHVRLGTVLSEISGTRPLLLASSAAVYGHAGAEGMALREDTPLPEDQSSYGAAKRDMESAAPGSIALRVGNIAGLDAILGGWKPGFELDTFADGTTPRRSYIGPGTLALSLAALCAKADMLPKVLNVAEPGVVSMGELLDAAELPYSPLRASDDAIAEVKLDVTRLRGHLSRLNQSVDPRRLVAEAKWLESAQIPT